MEIALNILHDRPLPELLDWWRLADDSGVAVIAVPDSPAVVRELYVASTLCLEHTRRAIVMTGVTNPVSRDPSVTAAAIASLHELAPGRVALGIGTGDSALWGVGLAPARIAVLREYILAVRSLLAGEEAVFRGRRFRRLWHDADAVDVPIIVPVAGPRVLRMAVEVADGALLSMGVGPDNVAHVTSLIDDACRDSGRSKDAFQKWWNSEVVFGETVDEARETALGVSTAWLTMGSLDGKQIPDELRDEIVRFNADAHDLASAYGRSDHARALVERARELGVYEWLIARAPGLWGTPQDIATRLRELGASGLDRWMFYVGRGPLDRSTHVRMLCEDVLPRLRS